MPSGKANQHNLTTLGAEDKEAASANRRVEPCGMESSGTEPCEWLHPPGARHQGQACHQNADAPPGVRLLLLRSPPGTTLREALDAQETEFLEQCCADHGMRTLDANLEAVTPQAIQNNILHLPPRARWRIVVRGTRVDGRQLETVRKGILLIILLRRMHRLVICKGPCQRSLGRKSLAVRCRSRSGYMAEMAWSSEVLCQGGQVCQAGRHGGQVRQGGQGCQGGQGREGCNGGQAPHENRRGALNLQHAPVVDRQDAANAMYGKRETLSNWQ
mmetsp:Transcript_57718/g.146421  ORF Transcript_57718/g.146421 Transcript_57718/m.146421 type:complete len:273 (-) Transcript_57718:312-1130(-)